MKNTLKLFGVLLIAPYVAHAQTTAQGWMDASDVFLSKNENDKALEALNKAIELEPKTPSVLIKRGMYYWQINDNAKALADAEAAAKIGSKDVEVLNSLANLFGTLSLSDKALEWYDKALQIDPKARWPLESRAMTLEEMAREKNNDKALFQKALGAYVTFTEAVPDAEIGWLRRGYIEFDFGLYEKAIASFTKTIALQKTPDATGYLWRGRAHLGFKKYDEAIADLQKGSALLGGSNEISADMARAYEGKNDNENALKYWNWAVGGLYSSAEDFKGRAAFYRKTGKIDLAIADEKKAAELEKAAQ